MPESRPASKNLYQKYLDVMPPGAGAIFFIQLLATTAFATLNYSLIFYTTNYLHMADKIATPLVASFLAFNYGLHLLGGYIGGRFMSYRSLFAIGMVLQCIGCLIISAGNLHALYWGLSPFLAGAGLNVTCINCMLTQRFQPEDKRRESAFLWNYAGMNAGFFVALYVSGYLQQLHMYRSMFLFGAAGNLATLILTMAQWKKLPDINTTFSRLTSTEKKSLCWKGIALIVGLLIALKFLLESPSISNALILGGGTFMLVLIAVFARTQSKPEARKKIWAYLILWFASLVFFILYSMPAMAINLFMERNVDLHFLGIAIAPQWLQNINPLVIMLGGPLFSGALTVLRGRGYQISIPLQFSLGLMVVGFGLALLPIGIHFANAAGYLNINWIMVSFALQAMGEVFIGPIGYALVGQLAPQNLLGVMMGTWMMATGIGSIIAGKASSMALGTVNSTDPLITNTSFAHTFNLLGWGTLVVGVLLFMAIPFILHLIGEKKLSARTQSVTPVGF